jgi:hypothetical protein
MKQINEQLTAEQVYEMFKSEAEYAQVGEFGFDRRKCVAIHGYDDKVLAVIFPQFPKTWEKHFNAVLALNKKNAVVIQL